MVSELDFFCGPTIMVLVETPAAITFKFLLSFKKIGKNILKNVLLIIPELGNGGAQVSILKLVRILSERYLVYLCVFHTQLKAQYPSHVRIIDLKTPPTSNVFRKLFNWYKRFLSIRKIKRDQEINVSISYLEGANYLNIISRRNEKVVASIRGSKTNDRQIDGILGKLRKGFLIPQLYQKADTIVTVSRGLEYEMASDYNIDSGKIITIPNFYDLRYIYQQAQQRLPQDYQYLFNKPVLVHSGRFHQQKEHLKLLEVFRLVRQQVDCRLLLLGDGKLKADIKNRAQSLKLVVSEDAKPVDVCLVGFQQNPFQFITRANLFVFTSSWEGFPNALAEAMICGTPVISTDCPTGPRELLAPETDIAYQTAEPEETLYGWLMPLLNDQRAIEQWADRVIHLLNKPDATKATAARQRMEEFSQEKIARQWFEIIEE